MQIHKQDKDHRHLYPGINTIEINSWNTTA